MKPLRSAPALGAAARPTLRDLPALAARALARHRRIVAAGCASLAVVIALSGLTPSRPPTVQVVAAARDLASGAVLKPDDVRWVTLPVTAEPAGAFTAMADVVGRPAAGPIRRGEPITDVRLVGGHLAGAGAGTPLAPPGEGLVATPVRLADVQAAALLRVGEHVDVLAATASSGVTSAPTLAVVVATDARVVAAPSSSADGQGALGSSADGGGALVVLATTTEQARALAQAELTARLSAVVVR